VRARAPAPVTKHSFLTLESSGASGIVQTGSSNSGGGASIPMAACGCGLAVVVGLVPWYAQPGCQCIEIYNVSKVENERVRARLSRTAYLGL
jgi:hypothetical protein